MKKKRIFGLAGLAAVVLAAGAGIYYTTSHHGSKGNGDLKVVTSFYPVYEFTKQVVGDEGEVSYLIPAGSEAHDFQPSTKNVADIEKADTFVYLNENMETWVPKVEKSINTKNTKVIKASQGMVLLPGTEEEDHDHGGEEHHHEYDPHVWLSPKRSQKLVETIRDGLIAQHPDKKAVFTTNAEKYLKKLKTLDKEYTEAFSQAKQKSFVTQHAAFAYLALDYGLTQVPILGVSAESDPSAKRIASLSKYVKEYDINYIYFEENASSSVAKTLANEVGVKTAVLNPIESLTKEQLKKGEDYVSVMTENLKNLRLTTDVEGKAIQPETGSDDKKTVQNGYFDDKDVKDRELSDWSGEWQSVYPYLQDGTLDQVFEYKSLLNKDKTAQEYKEYYTKGYQTDVSKIAIDGKKMTMTFTKNDGSSVTHTYRYDGYKILTYASGKKGVRYLFTATDSQAADNPYQYVQFSDHQIDPTKSAHFHIFFGNSSQDEILKEMDNWPTYYPGKLSGFEIAQEMVSH